MIEMLAGGSLDVAFALEVEPPDGLQRLELSSEELALAMSPDHALAGPGPLSIDALSGHRLISFQRGSSSRMVIDAALAEAGVKPRIAFEANDFALVRALVARGLGLAILPRSFLERPGAPIAVRSLSPALQMRVVLWWRSGRRLSPAARAFVDFAAAHRPA
jgi:DNA-binding transcriptional LysR family regulator